MNDQHVVDAARRISLDPEDPVFHTRLDTLYLQMMPAESVPVLVARADAGYADPDDIGRYPRRTEAADTFKTAGTAGGCVAFLGILFAPEVFWPWSPPVIFLATVLAWIWWTVHDPLRLPPPARAEITTAHRAAVSSLGALANSVDPDQLELRLVLVASELVDRLQEHSSSSAADTPQIVWATQMQEIVTSAAHLAAVRSELGAPPPAGTAVSEIAHDLYERRSRELDIPREALIRRIAALWAYAEELDGIAVLRDTEHTMTRARHVAGSPMDALLTNSARDDLAADAINAAATDLEDKRRGRTEAITELNGELSPPRQFRKPRPPS